MHARGEGQTVNLAATFHQDPSWRASLQTPNTQHDPCCRCRLDAHTAPIPAMAQVKASRLQISQGSVCK